MSVRRFLLVLLPFVLLGMGLAQTVGVSWSNFQEERWRTDEAAMRTQIETMGGVYISADAQSSIEKQIADSPEAATNRIGGPLLLPKQFNASCNADPYEANHLHYFRENFLAVSLYPLRNEKAPGFVPFVKYADLPARAYEQFKVCDLGERGELYRAIGKQVWNPDDRLAAASGGV
jgi:hypothetical protein